MGVVHRLVPKPERLSREAAAQVGEQLRLFPDAVLPAWARAEVLNAVYRITQPDADASIWPGGFCMLSRAQTAAIWEWIWKLPGSARPHKVRRAFDLVLLNLRHDTGEVMLSREQMAERMEVTPAHLSEVMGTLESAGIIRRERRRVEGMRGPGLTVYFVNPHVAWNGSLEIRKAQAEEIAPPLLRIMDGGAAGESGEPLNAGQRKPRKRAKLSAVSSERARD